MRLPNELLIHILRHVLPEDRIPFLFVSHFTHWLVCQDVYRRVVFPDTCSTQDILAFCQKYGPSLTTLCLPVTHYSNAFLQLLFQLCPHMHYLQSRMTLRQLYQVTALSPVHPTACFMLTHVPSAPRESGQVQSGFSSLPLPCCSSYFVFPSSETSLTHIAHYYHHPGALQNAILPTFGMDVVCFTLNTYDVLTVQVARLIVTQCPKLRYLVAPVVKAEGLWVLLRWCHSLAAVVVGGEEWTTHDNEAAVKSIQHHRRVWCLHQQSQEVWHVGILPKQ
ncbi:hypothetical protein BDF14DRAFT_1838755 [Spinellus fusiger]|nr:hypothetical protein BDF14DRAFT_1838755 [Spinellus fusiger]